MILVIDGPSAVGKTTWVRGHAAGVAVRESRFTPPVGSIDAEAEYWATAYSSRWRAALVMERARGVAVCDTDPLKLHFQYGMAMLGEVPVTLLAACARACRAAIAAGTLGIADTIACSIPDSTTLRRRQDARPRPRPRFDLYLRLAPFIGCWYEALADLDPSRVVWGLPDVSVVGRLAEGMTRERYDLVLFDRWMAALGIVMT